MSRSFSRMLLCFSRRARLSFPSNHGLLALLGSRKSIRTVIVHAHRRRFILSKIASPKWPNGSTATLYSYRWLRSLRAELSILVVPGLR